MLLNNNKTKPNTLVIFCIILLVCYGIFYLYYILNNYLNKDNTNKLNNTVNIANIQNLKEETTVKNANKEPNTKVIIIHKAKIDYIPKISVIIPVYNTSEYLRECLDSVINQTLKEIEIICVDDGSTDNSLDILKEYAKKDKRITIIKQENRGSAAARNQGILIAKGEYIGFIDSDDKISLDYYKLLYKNARKNKSDISATSNIKRFNKQKIIYNVNAGFNNKHLISTIKDKGNIIIKTGISWNKIYNRNFLIKNNIKCLEIKNAAEDNYFTDISIITANKISVIDNAIYYYRLNLNSLTKVTKDTNSFSMTDIYKHIDKFILNLNIPDTDKYKWLRIINIRKIIDYKAFYKDMKYEYKEDFEKHFLQNFPELYKYTRPLIISLTSYPARINTVYLTIESLLNQTKKADKVILWLTIEEFPNKERDLPKQLLDLTEKGLTIEWYKKNIKSYKKLIPVLEKYPEAIIVTADDDLIYNKYWLIKLYNSYKKYPNYIHCHRGRKINIDTISQNIKSYNTWNIIKRKYNIIPSYLIFPTTGAGILYPPHSLSKEVLNEEKFIKLSPTGDDIWFWANAVLNNIKIKVVDGNITKLNYIDGTQKDCLWKINIHKNDEQLNNVLKEYPEIIVKLYKQILFDYLEQYHLYPYYVWKFILL